MGFLTRLLGLSGKQTTGSDTGSQPSAVPPEISPSDLRKSLATADPPFLLDVRELQELRSHGFIPGAVHIPMNSVPGRLEELPADRPIVVYCAHGVRSARVAQYLLDRGFSRVANLHRGFAAWKGPRQHAR